MNKLAWLRRVLAVSLAACFLTGAIGVHAQTNPPWITIPSSAVAMGEVTTVTGGNFAPGSVVTLKVTAPGSGGWSQTLGVGADGAISYPVQFGEEGLYKLEVLAREGGRLTMLMVSSARRN